MEKINVKLRNPVIKVIKYKDYEIKINLNDVIKIDGFIPVVSNKKINDSSYEVYTSVLDSNYNVVVPIRKEIISLQRIQDDDLTINIMLFKNGKSIYQTDEYCYLVDLNSVLFDENDIPVNEIMKFRAYYSIGNGKVIVYNEDNSYLLDINNNKINGFVCDFIKPSTTFKDLYEVYFSKKENGILTLAMMMHMNDDGVPSEEVIVNNTLIVYPFYETFENKEELVKYCDDCYDEFIKTGGILCKQIN